MKKLIYIILFAFVTAMSVSACTEEEITPTTELNGGGNHSYENKNYPSNRWSCCSNPFIYICYVLAS